MSEVQEEGSGTEKSTLNGISSIVAACDPRNSVLNWLLIAVPIAFYAKIAHLDESIQFISSQNSFGKHNDGTYVSFETN